jgi:hypothetical protein
MAINYELYSPINTLISFVSACVGVLTVSIGLKRLSPWVVLLGWLVTVVGGAGVLFAILWWTIVT